MKALVALLLLTAFAVAAGQDEEYEFPDLDRNLASCSAYASLNIRVSQGSCSGTSSADCAAVAASTDAYASAYQEWWVPEEEKIAPEDQTTDEDGIVDSYGPVDPERVCDEDMVEAAATAIATAVAEVWTNALVKVTCDDDTLGFACGYAIANGEAWAIAFAEAVAIAAADVSKGNVDAFCYADIQALSAAFAEAAATSLADTCTNQGTAEDYASDYAGAIVDAIADALARATVTACDGGEEVAAASLCEGKATSTIDRVAIAGDAAAGQVGECIGNAAKCCMDPYVTRITCGCDDCDGPLRSLSEPAAEGAKKSWKSTGGTLCVCF